MHCFKIWNNTRAKKAIIVIHDEHRLCENVISKASIKLGINGATIVLESDGTLIDEDEALVALKSETFLLLEANQLWYPNIPDGVLSPAGSTVSVLSSASSLATRTSTPEIEGVLQSDNSPAPENSNNNFVSDSDSAQIIDLQAEDTTQLFQINLEYVWANFKIPWNKIPSHMLNACVEGKRNKQIVTEIVHIVINEMRQIKTNIPRHAIKIVANELCKVYPKMFCDFDQDGAPIGDGTCTVFSKLLERAAYLNRPHKRKASDVPSPTVSPALKKKKLNSMAGCSNWQPSIPSSSNATQQEVPIIRFEESDEASFYKSLEDTYCQQRVFLNNIDHPPSVSDIKQKWPVLFTKKAVTWHFKKLTSCDLQKLPKDLQEKANLIVEFGLKSKIISTRDLRNVPYQSLEVIAKYFKEDLSYLIYTHEDDGTVKFKTNAPCMVQNKDKDDEEQLYDVYMEKEKIMKNLTFVEAFTCCFAFYFIINLEYPKEISTLLEMVQRFYLKIHPDTGSKSKKSNSSKRKVISLMNKLKPYFLLEV